MDNDKLNASENKLQRFFYVRGLKYFHYTLYSLKSLSQQTKEILRTLSLFWCRIKSTECIHTKILNDFPETILTFLGQPNLAWCHYTLSPACASTKYGITKNKNY